jgi:iron complex outermembrane receptor protein
VGIVKFSSDAFPAQAYLLGPTQQVFAVSKYPTCSPPDSFPYLGGCRYDYTHYIDIYPESERAGALARANFQLDKGALLFAEVRLQPELHHLRPTRQTPSVTTGKPIYTYPGGGKWYPTAAVDAVRPGVPWW